MGMWLPPTVVVFADRPALLEFAQEWHLVPAHSVRHNYHRERFIVSRYLLALVDAGRLGFPIRLEHIGLIQSGASPDFRLTLADGQTIGIEVTEASTSELHRRFAENETRWMDSDEEAVADELDAHSRGWLGDAHVREWAALVFAFISRKVQQLNKGHFQPADHQDLVVYADTPAPLIELKPALNELLNLVAKAKTVGADFRSTSIITTTNRLVFDLFHDPVVLPMPIISNPFYDFAWTLKEIRNEVMGLLCNRYVFRTVQEIVRRNPHLQGSPRGRFSDWTHTVYATANAVAVRRLASQYDANDVSLLKLLDDIIRDPKLFWPRFERFFPEDAAAAKAAMATESSGLAEDWNSKGVRRLVGRDRSSLINAAEKANQFASKRVAHNNPSAEVRTKFRDLDQAIDTVKELAEKYFLLIYEERGDLLRVMVERKLPKGWDAIFLEPWTTEDVLVEKLGEMEPPMFPTQPKPGDNSPEPEEPN
jgi:hypothetical protein